MITTQPNTQGWEDIVISGGIVIGEAKIIGTIYVVCIDYNHCNEVGVGKSINEALSCAVNAIKHKVEIASRAIGMISEEMEAGE